MLHLLNYKKRRCRRIWTSRFNRLSLVSAVLSLQRQGKLWHLWLSTSNNYVRFLAGLSNASDLVRCNCERGCRTLFLLAMVVLWETNTNGCFGVIHFSSFPLSLQSKCLNRSGLSRIKQFQLCRVWTNDFSNRGAERVGLLGRLIDQIGLLCMSLF